MKKTLLIAVVSVLALGALGASVAFAQGRQPNQPGSVYGPGWMMGGYGGYGAMHDYVEQALADKLGLTEEQVEEALADGTTMYQLVLDNGVDEADLPAFLDAVHEAAFDKAVADGVMTQEQADWMEQRMDGMYANGYGTGDCPMGGTQPQDGTGFQGRYGGGMMGGGRWQQTQP